MYIVFPNMSRTINLVMCFFYSKKWCACNSVFFFEIMRVVYTFVLFCCYMKLLPMK